jgi:hypothetical protein
MQPRFKNILDFSDTRKQRYIPDIKEIEGGPALKKLTVSLMGLVLFLSLISPCSAEEIKHTVVKGDTLWDISMKYLKTPWKWPLVWANNEDITNPHLIYPGDIVVITKDGEKTVIKIISSKGGTESKMTIYTPEEAGAAKGKTIVVSPQYSTFVYSMGPLHGIGPVTNKIESGDFIAQNDHIIIKTNSELKVGQALTIVTKLQDIQNGKKRAGYLYRAVAIACVEEVQPGAVKANITYSTQEAKIGSIAYDESSIVYDDIEQFKPLTLKISEPATNLSAKIMDLYGGVLGVGTNDLAFIEAGKNQGLEKGMLLNITKQIKVDEKEKKGEASPVSHDYVGMLLILQARDNNSMGLILDSKTLIERGFEAGGKK